MSHDVTWGICLNEVQTEGEWVVARTCGTEAQLLTSDSVPTREKSRLSKDEFVGHKLVEKSYLVDVDEEELPGKGYRFEHKEIPNA